jgi:hypothetical protein
MFVERVLNHFKVGVLAVVDDEPALRSRSAGAKCPTSAGN